MTLYNNVASNRNKTALYLGLFLVFIIALGWLFSLIYNNDLILVIVVVISVAQALIAYYSGDKIALSISGAIGIEKKDNPTLWNIVENLAITAGLPTPKIYIIPDDAPNAFATGRDPNHASIAVTTGILEVLDKNELQGVIAHELSHIGDYDIRLSTILVVLVGVVALLSDLFLRFRLFGFGGRNREGGGEFGIIMLIIAIIAAILAPVIATLIQLAISRKREFMADSNGALLTRYPDGLASALEKIGFYTKPMRRVSSSTSHLFISDPMGKNESFFAKLFSTHPPISERIRALEGMKLS